MVLACAIRGCWGDGLNCWFSETAGFPKRREDMEKHLEKIEIKMFMVDSQVVHYVLLQFGAAISKDTMRR